MASRESIWVDAPLSAFVTVATDVEIGFVDLGRNILSVRVNRRSKPDQNAAVVQGSQHPRFRDMDSYQVEKASCLFLIYLRYPTTLCYVIYVYQRQSGQVSW